MKKKKIYLILGILTTIILFTTAALCNWCMVQPEEELVEETEQEPAEEETTEEVEEEPSAEEEKEEIGEEEITEEEEESIREEAEEEVTEEVVEEAEEELSPPTINLKIYYGPQFSPYDAVCYYRIEAEVTGNPTPEVEFSKDDSHGAWGDRKCQVNLESTSDTYTLTATATNSEGTATDSIAISWGCSESFEEAEAGDEEEEAEDLELELGDMGRFFEGGILPPLPVMVIHPFNIGYIIRDDGVNTTDFIIGDSMVNNKKIYGFFAFDWRDFEGKEIEQIVLQFETYKVHGNPTESGILEDVELYACPWYLPTLEYDDIGTGGLNFGSFNFNQDTVKISGELLTTALKAFIDRHENYGYYLVSGFFGPPEADYVTDGREYTKDTISLFVWYSE
jgi:hypothetical protein